MAETKKYPIIEEIKSGWAAIGDGWAVHAPTKEDVVKKYEERKKFYEWLATQPFVYEQREAQRIAAEMR